MAKYLIADDHAVMRTMLRDLLAGKSDIVFEARDGAEAEAIFEKQLPHCVIMDVQMHPVGGLAATETIMSRHPNARVIILTLLDDPGLREKALELGAFAYVTKDDLLKLPDVVRAALKDEVFPEIPSSKQF